MGTQPGTGPLGPHEQMLLYRVEALERQVRDLVPANVNELQLQNIRDAIELLRHEIRETAIKNEAKHEANSNKIEALNTKVDTKINAIAAGLDQFKIWALTGIIVIFLTLIGFFVSAYATHLIH